MRKLAIGLTAAMALGLCVQISTGADEKKISGVLIDDHCAANFTSKDNPEKAAASHKAACAIKCAKDGDLVLLTGKKELKLDKAGKDMALAYLAKPDASTHVTITGEATDTEIKVKSIEAAKASSKD
jgi:hypothetical protein